MRTMKKQWRICLLVLLFVIGVAIGIVVAELTEKDDEPTTTAQSETLTTVAEVTDDGQTIIQDITTAEETTAVGDFEPADIIGMAQKLLTSIADNQELCADGGWLMSFEKDVYPNTDFSTFDEDNDESCPVKAVYITDVDTKIVGDLYTGKAYGYYAEKIDGLTSLIFDELRNCYTCGYTFERSGKTLNVILCFTSADGVCDGAIISSEVLESKTGSAPVNPEAFAVSYIGLTKKELISRIGELEYVGIYDGATFFSAVNRLDTPLFCFGLIYDTVEDIPEDDVVSSVEVTGNNVELFEGFTIGHKYEYYKEKGIALTEPSEGGDQTSSYVSFRLGARHLMCWINYDDSLTATSISAICKNLV